MRSVICILLSLIVNAVAGGGEPAPDPLASRLHVFYYPWYGTPEHDGEFVHWRHAVLGEGATHTYPGGDDIGADFYPAGGCYSSGDPAVMRRHMRQLQRARIGVICVSWLGANSRAARRLPRLMDIAAEHGIQVNFHLEPAVQRSIRAIRESVVHIIDTYGGHPAFYRAPETSGRGLFYVYDSYNTASTEWARLLTPGGDLTIRGTARDAAVVGLLLTEGDKRFIETGGLDGGYSYFAVDGFSYGSTVANWPALAAWARDRNLLFIPSVGPGYSDQRIRPWNQRNLRGRDAGRYYDCMFAGAIRADPSVIGITSFNEWHEGTQIEPAAPHHTADFTYRDYAPLSPDAYLLQTSEWLARWSRHLDGNRSPADPALSLCGGGPSRRAVVHMAVGRPLRLNTPFSETYPAGGQAALVDGFIGSAGYRDGCWQGYQGVDLEADIDLGRLLPVAELRLGFLRDREAWIFLPRRIRVTGSPDGATYTRLMTVPVAPETSADPLRHAVVIDFAGRRLRYLRIAILAEKTCPPGHPGAGQPAWLFADEIQVMAPPAR